MHYLESFTDSLVVTEEDEKPIGIIGGKEVIVNIFENPSSDFFDKTTVEQVMDKNLIILSEKIKNPTTTMAMLTKTPIPPSRGIGLE